MITIAIDGSTKSTGVAIFDDKELIKYECITSNNKNVLTRIKYMTDEIEKIYLSYKNIDFQKDLTKAIITDEEIKPFEIQVIMEQIIPDNLKDVTWSKNQATFKALFYLQAAIVLMFHHYNIDVEFYGASTWRSKCGIRQGGLTRDTLKLKDKEFVQDTYSISVNDDIADAICIGHAKVNTKPEPQPFNWG